MILDIAKLENIPAREKNLSLTELYSAEEAFTTGTMGELTPIIEADGRIIADGKPGGLTRRLQKLHREYAYEHGEPLPFL
jgi:branched-subunit amino acid aminotransferase/4-amino-4-deoxychorismate lyase